MTDQRARELEQRRDEVARSLPGLSREKEATYRHNCDALALDRAGVKHEGPAEMSRLNEAADVADKAIRNAHIELRDIDAEIDSTRGRGLGAKFGRAFRRAR